MLTVDFRVGKTNENAWKEMEEMEISNQWLMDMGFSLADADISRAGWPMDDIVPVLIKANDMHTKS